MVIWRFLGFIYLFWICWTFAGLKCIWVVPGMYVGWAVMDLYRLKFSLGNNLHRLTSSASHVASTSSPQDSHVSATWQPRQRHVAATSSTSGSHVSNQLIFTSDVASQSIMITFVKDFGLRVGVNGFYTNLWRLENVIDHANLWRKR
jgi:hypothetical protein